jgi:hypothetical protein
MRRKGLGIWLAVSMAALAMPPGAHFQKVDASVNNDAQLVVSFQEAGVGKGAIQYQLVANITASYACVNSGGKVPKAQQFTQVSEGVFGAASFETRNGRITGSIVIDPPGSNLNCSNGQIEKLFAVSCSGILLTDVTNGLSAAAPDVARAFPAGITVP